MGIFDERRRQFRTSAKKGVSDILACFPPTGQLIAIEVKIGKDKLSDEQKGFMANVSAVGGQYFIASDFDNFQELWYKQYPKVIPS